MKPTMTMPRESKAKRIKKKPTITVEGNAVRTLSTLGDAQAFHFYEALGKPTGQCARSLREFLEKIESIKPESLIFHHERDDFKNWIANTLEDSKLAQKIEMIPKKHHKQIRTGICTAVKTRIKELEVTILVAPPEAVHTLCISRRSPHYD